MSDTTAYFDAVRAEEERKRKERQANAMMLASNQGQGKASPPVMGNPAMFMNSSPAASGGTGATTGGASSTGGSALASAGPWAALAAAVIGNETAATQDGRRDSNKGEYAKDLATGAVLAQDMEYYSPKVFGKGDETGLGKDMVVGSELASGDVGSALKGVGNTTAGKSLKKLKDLSLLNKLF